MNVGFAGTPEFAAAALRRLVAAGFRIPLVLTQPDRPAGRGMKLQASAVKQFALAHQLPVAQPRSLRLDGKFPEEAAAARAQIEAARLDVLVVAAYGLILPPWVLQVPRLGCINIHASLLPRWRGAAPIHRAIEAGDAQTGITIMQMDAGLDTGDMLLVERLAIRPDDTTGSLHDRLADLGGRLVVEALEIAACGGLDRTPQPAEGATYAHKIEKAEAALDWRADAALLARRLRAFDPFPGATARLGGETVKCWRGIAVDAPPPGAAAHAGDGGTGTGATTASDAGAQPGTVLAADAAGITVACGVGALRLTELQRPGGRRVSAAQFLQGHPVTPGTVLES